MRTILSVIPLVLAVSAVACIPLETTEKESASGSPPERPAPSSSPSAPSSTDPGGRPPVTSPLLGGGVAASGETILVAGWTTDGDVALFDAATGAVVASAAGAGASGERDLAVDPWLSRLLVFEGDPEGTWGEIASYPLADGADYDPSLGARKHEVWIDGVARVAASPFGAVVFEEGYGARWRLLRADGEPSPSALAPRPMSLATESLPGGGLRVSALTYGIEGDAPDIRVAEVGSMGVNAPVTVPVLVPPLSSPPAARWVVSAGGGHVVDAANGEAMITTFAGSGWPAWMPVGVGPNATRIEQAEAFSGGNRLALLTSGDVDLVVLSVGAGGAPECAAALEIPGEAEKAPLFFARGLVPVGAARVLVATTSGVFAVEVSADCPPSLTIDADFVGGALRGPLDRWE